MDPTSFGSGRYKVVMRLGEGGMAEVHVAVDTRRKIPVAIKKPLPEMLLHRKAIERFGQEAETHGRVIHPNVATMLGTGMDVLPNGTRIPFMVIEYVPGVNVEQCIREFGALPPEVAGRILLPVLGALRVMHGSGVFHRDIKPANVMVGWNPSGWNSSRWDEGAVRLMDFGIARHTGTADRKTGTKVVMGTDGYIAPEQFRSTKDVDHMADVYSMGATLWAMLAGLDPTDDLHNLTLNDKAFSDLSEPWRTIAFGATRYKREERAYQSAEELARAICDAVSASSDRTGPFESWLLQKKRDSPVEAALRRAFGVGLTMVAEAEENGQGDRPPGPETQWFNEGEIGASAAPAQTEEPSGAPAPRRFPRKPAVVGAGIVALLMALLAVFAGPFRTDAVVSAPPTADVPSIIEKVEPNPDVPVVDAIPTIAAVPTEAPPPDPKAKAPNSKKIVPSIVVPVPQVVAPEPVPVPVATPVVAAPETGTVRLKSGASYISLVGQDGTSYPAGAVPPGTYVIKAAFPKRGEVANAGTLIVYAGQNAAVTCLEASALCASR